MSDLKIIVAETSAGTNQITSAERGVAVPMGIRRLRLLIRGRDRVGWWPDHARGRTHW